MALQDSKIIAERIRQYGNNFPMIAKLFNQYFKMNGLNMSRDITEYDVCMLMGLMKISRISANPDHEDSIIDMMNYFNIGFNFEEYKKIVDENTGTKKTDNNDKKIGGYVGNGQSNELKIDIDACKKLANDKICYAMRII